MKRIFTPLFTLLVGLCLFAIPQKGNAQCGPGESSFSYCYGFGEVNNVAFEVCPTAGMIAEADITQGTFDPFFPNTLTVYQGASGSGTGGTIVFGPTGGTPMGPFNDVSGNTITSTVADECLIFVINTVPVPGFDCATGAGTFLAVEACGRSLPAAAVTFTALADLCADAGVQTGLSGGNPPGGFYSGDGVMDNGLGTGYSFDPVAAGTGTTTITYEVPGTGSASDDVEVFATPTFTALADLCIDAGVQTGLSGGSPGGGVYSGDGVTDNGGTYGLDPGAAGLGVHTITYTTAQGCSTTDDVEVLAACGCPVGFTNHFYCYNNFEVNTVAFEVCPTAGMAAKGTISSGTFEEIPGPQPDDNLTVYEGPSGSGTGGTPIFGPSTGNLAGSVISGTGANNCLIFVVNSDGAVSCANDEFGTVTGLAVCGESIAAGTVVNFVASPGTVCKNGGTVVIGGGTPAGGTYSGPGVIDDNNGMTFTFNPMGAGVVVGNNTVTYTNGGSANSTVMVVDIVAAMADPGVTFCPSDGPQFLSGLGTPSGAGGVYSGTGVTNLGDGVNFLFNPSGLSGMYPVTYTFTDANGCVGAASTNFEVTFPAVTFTAPADLCLDAGVQAGLGGGTPTGGMYSGDGVIDAGNGMNYSFDPNVVATGPGIHTITYTYTSPSNGCSASASDDVEVFDLPNVTFTAPADLCVDAGVQAGLGGGLPLGGAYSGDGVTDDGNGMTYSFDPSINGAGAGVHTITYEFTDSNGCMGSDSDDIEVFDLPSVSFPDAFAAVCENGSVQSGLGGGMPEGGVYSGVGITDDSNGMTFSLDPSVPPAGTNTTVTYLYTDANGCMGSASVNIDILEKPTVTFTAPADLCINAGVQAGLGGGTPTGGTYSGPGVMDDGNGETYSFDPDAVDTGAGTYMITYSFTDGNGCSDAVSDDIEVFGLPTITCPDDIAVNNDPGQCNADVTVPAPSVIGGCFGTTITNDYNGTADASDNYDVGPTTVTFTVTDGNGNTATCSMSVTVNDNEPPILTCNNPTVALDANGQYTLTQNDVFGGGTDNCGTVNYEGADPAVLDCDDLGTTVSVMVTANDGNGNTGTCTANVTVTGPAPTVPTVDRLTRSSCVGSSSTVRTDPAGAGLVINWKVVAAPAGASFMVDDILGAGENGTDYRTDLDADGRRLRIKGNMMVVPGTYQFQAFMLNEATGCTSELTPEIFEINIYAQPTVDITADPDGDLCLNTVNVQYDATIMATDDGTYSYDWCAYNSGDGSGTCFDGFIDNTAQNPTRSWTSSAGPKSVGVTVTSDVQGCSASALYSFEVVAPTMVACPADLTTTLITDDLTFDCEAIATFNNPSVIPGPCDPVILTITISGPVSSGPEVVTPGALYTATFDELGDYLVTYDLIDAVGNTSTCSFTITVDGLPCGWVDNGGINCAGSNSDYDLGASTFELTAGTCAPAFPYTADATSFVFTELCGDGEIIARVDNISGGQGFAGVMARDSEAPGSPMMSIGTNTLNRVRKEVRVLPDYPAFPQAVVAYDQFWVRITRTGPSFRGFASPDGVNWFPYLFQNIQMGPCIRVGLYAYNEKEDSPITATFSNVSINGIPVGVTGGSSTTTFLNQDWSGYEKQSELNPTIDLFPNPTNSELNVELSGYIGQRADISLYNSVGQQVMVHRIDEVQGATERLDVTRLEPGLYTIAFKIGDALITKRVVIARP